MFGLQLFDRSTRGTEPTPYGDSVGRLEPGYAAPDLVPEALYSEPMTVKRKPGWAAFLAQISFLQKRGAAAFMSRTVGLHFQRQGLLKVLALKVPIDIPPVGIITMRGRRATPSTEQLVDCLRRAANQKA